MTSRFADPAILQRAAKLSLRIIPKGLVGQVPIVVQGSAGPPATDDPPSRPRVLVIDDDTMIAWAWRKQQQRLGIAELVAFPSMEACEAAAPDYRKLDLTFVDLNIEGPNGRWKTRCATCGSTASSGSSSRRAPRMQALSGAARTRTGSPRIRFPKIWHPT